MENIIRQTRAGNIPAEPAVVICDNPAAGAVQKASRLNVPIRLIDRKSFKHKTDFELEIIEQLEHFKADWVVLAGFMRILSPEFVRRFRGRIINIHPSFLPHFPGARAIQDAYEAKAKETGVTVHFVDEGVDSGPIILQEKIQIHPVESLETLEARIHAVEYDIYPQALCLVLMGKVRMPPSHS